MSIKTCPHCSGYYERRIKGKCPHCNSKIGQPIKKRTCPYCGGAFQYAILQDGVRHCPKCNAALFYPKGKLRGKTILLADKEAVGEMLSLLEKQISADDGTRFLFSGTERAGQLFHGYCLIEEANKFAKRQKQAIPGYTLAISAVKEGLANGLSGARTLLPFRSSAVRLISLAYAREKTRLDLSEVTFVDYSAFQKGA